jgi:hypothetical protein
MATLIWIKDRARPAKWVPVRVKETRQIKAGASFDSIKAGALERPIWINVGDASLLPACALRQWRSCPQPAIRLEDIE